MDSKTATWIDLGLLKVRREGARDFIHLGHNDELIVVVNCPKSHAATAKFLKEFYCLTPFQMKQVTDVYLIWKRETCPNFRPPMMAPHPWNHSYNAESAARKRNFFGQGA